MKDEITKDLTLRSPCPDCVAFYWSGCAGERVRPDVPLAFDCELFHSADLDLGPEYAL